ncbi:MAG: DUF2275 domain-containing protein [Deltaproteobacteria bacterium]|nr:DUF2275 domain-containing protein [Deltaproteobacteria bacterium]
MNCEHAKGLLPALLDTALPADETREIETHVAACEHCTRELAALRKAAHLVKELPEIEPPPFFAKKIMAEVRAASVPKLSLLKRILFPLHIKLPLEALAAVLVAVIAIQIYRTVGPESLRPSDMDPPRAPEKAQSREVAAKKVEIEVGPYQSRTPVVSEAERPQARDEQMRAAVDKAGPRRAPVSKDSDKKGFAAPPPAKKAPPAPDELSKTSLVLEKKAKQSDVETPRASAGAGAAGFEGPRYKKPEEEKASKPRELHSDEIGFTESPPPAPARTVEAERPAPRKLEAAPAEPAPPPPAGLARETGADMALDRPWLDESKKAGAEEKAEAEERPRAKSAFSAPAASAPPQVVTVRVDERPRAGEKLLELLPSVGARLTRKQVRFDRDVYFVEIASKNLVALVGKLKELGTVGKASVDTAGDETVIELRVEILGRPQ